MPQPVWTTRRAPLLATAFALLFIFSQALVQAGQSETGFFRYAIESQGVFSVGAVIGLVAGVALIGLAGLAEARLLSRFGRYASAGAGLLFVTTNAIRAVSPQYDFDTLEPYGQAVDTVLQGLGSAGLLLVGAALLDAVLRAGGLALITAVVGAASLISGTLLTAMLRAVDPGLAFGVTVVSLLIGLIATALWGLVST